MHPQPCKKSPRGAVARRLSKAARDIHFEKRSRHRGRMAARRREPRSADIYRRINHHCSHGEGPEYDTTHPGGPRLETLEEEKAAATSLSLLHRRPLAKKAKKANKRRLYTNNARTRQKQTRTPTSSAARRRLRDALGDQWQDTRGNTATV